MGDRGIVGVMECVWADKQKIGCLWVELHKKKRFGHVKPTSIEGKKLNEDMF